MTVVEELLAAGYLTPCFLLRLSHEKVPLRTIVMPRAGHPIGRSTRKNELYLFYLVCPRTGVFVRNSALISRYISGNVFYEWSPPD